MRMLDMAGFGYGSHSEKLLQVPACLRPADSTVNMCPSQMHHGQSFRWSLGARCPVSMQPSPSSSDWRLGELSNLQVHALAGQASFKMLHRKLTRWSECAPFRCTIRSFRWSLGALRPLSMKPFAARCCIESQTSRSKCNNR